MRGVCTSHRPVYPFPDLLTVYQVSPGPSVNGCWHLNRITLRWLYAESYYWTGRTFK